MGPWARTHGPQGLPARGRRAGGRRRGSPWGPWARAHGPMGPVPWAQALASGIYIGGLLVWVWWGILGGYWGEYWGILEGSLAYSCLFRLICVKKHEKAPP